MAASEFSALVCPDEAAVWETMCCKEFFDNVKGGGFGVRKEDPNIAGCLVNDKEVRGVPVMGEDNPVAPFGAGLLEVGCGSSKKSVIHVEATFAFIEAECRALDRLFSDPSLLFEVDEPERVVVKVRRKTCGVAREVI